MTIILTSLLHCFRESASIYICKYLLEEGARVTIYDPKVEEQQVYLYVVPNVEVINFSQALSLNSNLHINLHECFQRADVLSCLLASYVTQVYLRTQKKVNFAFQCNRVRSLT